MVPILAAAVLQSGEAYSRLAAAIPRAEWFAVSQAMVGKRVEGSFLAPNLSRLGIEKAAVERWSGVLLGLRKVSDEPYTPGPVGEDVPRLAGLLTYAAHVKFAAGERHGGVTYLLDGLKMAVRVRKEAPKPSDDCQSLVMAAFARNMGSVPLAECDRVRASVDPWLTEAEFGKMERARFVLLRLHMRIETYRWKNLKAPSQLAEAAPAGEIEKGCVYEITSGGYRLRHEEFGVLGVF